ncbi:MAG: methyltransferase [Chlorobiaceae bacterium]|nr:methyltransferase [Chlorobiaceae bacterium]
MSDWTSGYMADIDYTFGYYAELNPFRLKLAFLNAGLVFPETGTACELGYGQGLCVNIHAAGSLVDWYGTDFNPSQAAFAEEIASKSGANLKLYDEAFDDFCSRKDLPDFDYIGLHGIWSWISDENRHVIVDFIRRKLKVGGVLYISYNTMPGWAAFAPIRHLMNLHAEIIGADGKGILNRVDSAIDFTEKLLATNPLYSRVNPQIPERIKNLTGQNRQYLAHEYFNKHWYPMHFSTMADWLEPAKLQYAVSANFLDHIDMLHMSMDQQAFINGIPDPILRQSVRDFMVNQQFRKDYWVKGARRLTSLEQAETLRGLKVILTGHRPDIEMKVTGALGEASLNEEIYNPILDALSENTPKEVAQLEMELQSKGIGLAKILLALVLFSGTGHLELVQDEESIAEAKKTAHKINTYLMTKARGSNDINFLSSPVTGGGVHVGRIQQLFLLALIEGKDSPEEWARKAWEALRVQDQKLIRDGKVLESSEENLSELLEQARIFKTKRLPILKTLQVI